MGVSRAIRVFSKKLLSRGGVHFGVKWDGSEGDRTPARDPGVKDSRRGAGGRWVARGGRG